MTARFVHLHQHTEFSIVDSTARIPALLERTARLGMPAAALTDQSNLFGLVKFYRNALKNGVKPLIGCELFLLDSGSGGRPDRLVLLCKDRTGYRNLARIISRSFLEGRSGGAACVHPDWLDAASCEGLIALSGGRAGDVGRLLLGDHERQARARLAHWLKVFGDRYYLELVRTGRSGEEECLQRSLLLASRQSVPVVATNDVRFVDREDFFAHEARVCIHEGRGLSDTERPRHYSEEQYLKSPAEMSDTFEDLPEALANTVEVARRCTLELSLGETFLPAFPVPAGQDTDGFLRDQAEAGLGTLLSATETGPGDGVAADRLAAYRLRLDRELDVICDMGFAGYFLIVADFIRWAREQRIPVGPGRGSGAGSLVAYALGITSLDPLEHDLLFERFLNPERVSMPDFDVDFCMDGRDRVIEYVAERYGRDRVSQIITYGTMAAKAVIRDAGRVLGHPYGFVDRIAKLVPFEIGMTLERALDQEAELAGLYADDEAVAAIVDLAKSLEGLVRNAGKHAGGVVIAPTPLTEFTPLYCEDGATATVTQLDKDDVEAIGLVKFDFLGLRTLTVIDRAVRIINATTTGEPLDIEQIPMSDEATFRLLRSCDTTAVFQLESRGMRDLVKRLQPDQFDDLVALVALFRPGPLQSGMVDDFIARKHGNGEASIDYLHPDLKPVLESTYGVILYQEQVMQIAQVLAGYTLGGADLLRRAMGKKKPEEMAKQRKVFVTGATERGVEEKTATHIFDLMEKFAGYGFNKSHSAAYALLAYQTAYLKAHFPAAFMSAVMSTDLDNTDRLVVLKDDCRTLGLTLHPPCVNESAYDFSTAGDQEIRYGLGAIKGVGRAAVDALVEQRQARGSYENLDDLCRRIDLERVNRRALEAMIRGGAMDGFGMSRRGLMQRLDEALKSAEQEARAAAAGQNDLFGLSDTGPAVAAPRPEAAILEWSEAELLAYEKEALGLYLTGHPFDAVRDDADSFIDARLADLAAEPAPVTSDGNKGFGGGRREVTVAGLIVDLRKRGNRVTVTLDDDSGRLEVALFSEAFNEFRHLLIKDEIVVVQGTLRYDEFMSAWQVNARQVSLLDQLIEQRARRMILKVTPNGQGSALIADLHDALLPYREGRCEVALQYRGTGARARLDLGADWSVRPSRELRDKLSELLGRNSVRLIYTPDRR